MPERSQQAVTDTPFPDRIIRQLMVAYPHQAPQIFGDEVIGKEAWALWRGELGEMSRVFGEKRVDASVTRWIRSSEYLPEISQLRDGIAPEEPKPRWDPNCVECSGTGWKTITASDNRKRAQSVTKCDCHTKARPA